MSLFNRAVRDQRWVNRWGIVRRIKEQNIAEHQYFVALYALQICRDLEIPFTQDAWGMFMWKVLTHDLHEIITSDAPGPVKRAIKSGGVNQWVESELTNRIPGWRHPPNLTPEEEAVMEAVIKVADDFEAAMYIMDEKSLGNKNMEDVFRYINQKLYTSLDKLAKLLPDQEERIFHGIGGKMREQMESTNWGKYLSVEEKG